MKPRHGLLWAPGILAPLMVLLACRDGATSLQDITPIGNARAFGIWTPGPYDTCPASVHDQYAAVGPDHKRYPTWHPPVDPATGCSFGHEHGRDPSGSNLYRDTGPLPFGYANEQLETWDPLNPRNEDHVGHKIEWENGVRMHFDSEAANNLFDVRCDVLTKLHQGTHSRDAFTNNLHELIYHIRCTDGVEMRVTMMTAIGNPGEFIRSCDNAVTVAAGTATPATSPRNGGARRIPDHACVARELLVAAGQRSNFGALRESWETHNSIRTVSGHELAFFNPYYQVMLPSRVHDPAMPNATGRPVTACFVADSTGLSARGGPCDDLATPVAFDDPQSPFNGADRVVDVNYNHVRNAGGPTSWYTDPFGRNARPDSFPGAIRQRLSAMNNDRGGLGNGAGTIGRNRSYALPMVHAPN